MADDVIDGYAEALLTVARAEGDSTTFESELSQVVRAIEASDELRTTISNPELPAGRRQQIVEEILGGWASRVTTAMVSMVVAAGRAADLGRIADRMVELGAAHRGRVVAEVRSAIPLEPDQERRLTEALRRSTGKDVELKVIIDPSVIGGLVTQIDDQIIDGSVRTRIGQLRDAF